jgi:hypothetical protein
MAINQPLWHRTEAGGQTAHRTKAGGPTSPLWRLDRPSSNGLKSSRFDGQLILIMLVNCVINHLLINMPINPHSNMY